MICDDSKGGHWVQLSLGNGKFKDLGMVKNGWCGHGHGAHTQWADINGDGMADMLCDDNHGRHWAMLSMGDGRFKDMGAYKTGWCGHNGSYT